MASSANVRTFFDREAGGYGAKHFRRSTTTFIGVRQERILELVDELRLAPGARVLDAGCGPGLLTAELVRRGFRVVAFDVSAAMLAMVAHHRGRGDEAGRVQGDVEAIPFGDATFDLVCSAGVIEYLSRDENALSEFARVLRPDGGLIVSTTKAGAPVHLLEPLVERLKRHSAVLAALGRWRRWRGRPPVQARHFRVRTHRPSEFRRRLGQAGLSVVTDRFFYFVPWPHPVDRLLPGTSPAAERRLARSPSRGARWAAAGYIALARRPVQPPALTPAVR